MLITVRTQTTHINTYAGKAGIGALMKSIGSYSETLYTIYTYLEHVSNNIVFTKIPRIHRTIPIPVSISDA